MFSIRCSEYSFGMVLAGSSFQMKCFPAFFVDLFNLFVVECKIKHNLVFISGLCATKLSCIAQRMRLVYCTNSMVNSRTCHMIQSNECLLL